jgi:hypothetical protein
MADAREALEALAAEFDTLAPPVGYLSYGTSAAYRRCAQMARRAAERYVSAPPADAPGSQVQDGAEGRKGDSGAIPQEAIDAGAEPVEREFKGLGPITAAKIAKLVLEAATPVIRSAAIQSIAPAAESLTQEALRARRKRIAASIREQQQACTEHPMPFPKPSCWTCGRNGAFERAARIALGEMPC